MVQRSFVEGPPCWGLFREFVRLSELPGCSRVQGTCAGEVKPLSLSANLERLLEADSDGSRFPEPIFLDAIRESG